MTKEEILFKISGVRNIHHCTYNATEVEMAMDEYAKEECIAFLIYAFGDAYNTKLFSEYAEYLYKQYLKSKELTQ
mgnify:CR=1 FL=1